MTAEKTTGTATGNLVTACIRRGYRGLGAKIVIAASDNRSVQEWLYRYLEPYEAKGYGFYLVQREADFLECAGKADTVMAFVEDMFFGERTIGRLDYVRKQYPKLRPVLFSASRLPLGVAARYVCRAWAASCRYGTARGKSGKLWKRFSGNGGRFRRT